MTPSFPRKRESSDLLRTTLGPRFRGDDGSLMRADTLLGPRFRGDDGSLMRADTLLGPRFRGDDGSLMRADTLRRVGLR